HVAAAARFLRSQPVEGATSGGESRRTVASGGDHVWYEAAHLGLEAPRRAGIAAASGERVAREREPGTTRRARGVFARRRARRQGLGEFDERVAREPVLVAVATHASHARREELDGRLVVAIHRTRRHQVAG